VRGRSSERTVTGWSAHLNEILPGRNADPTGPGGHLSRPVTCDARRSPCGFYDDGQMDDVRVWSRELSSSQISSLYSSPSTFSQVLA
jgi:hypothetical protein